VKPQRAHLVAILETLTAKKFLRFDHPIAAGIADFDLQSACAAVQRHEQPTAIANQ
jgi:hypothetical protein